MERAEKLSAITAYTVGGSVDMSLMPGWYDSILNGIKRIESELGIKPKFHRISRGKWGLSMFLKVDELDITKRDRLYKIVTEVEEVVLGVCEYCGGRGEPRVLFRDTVFRCDPCFERLKKVTADYAPDE